MPKAREPRRPRVLVLERPSPRVVRVPEPRRAEGVPEDQEGKLAEGVLQEPRAAAAVAEVGRIRLQPVPKS